MKKIICVALPKGGVGKTTTSFNLSIGLNREHTVSLIDLDRNKQSTKINNVLNKLNVFSADTPKQLKDLLQSLDSEFIIIDTFAFDSELQRWAMYWSDIVIVPVSASGNDLTELIPFVDTIENNIFVDNDYTKCFLLPNRIHYSNNNIIIELQNYFKDKDRFEVMNFKISNLSVYGAMMEKGLSVFDLGNTRSINENYKLVDKIIKECDNER